MKYFSLLSCLLLLLSSCVKYESIELTENTTVNPNLSQNYFPHEDYYLWTFADQDGYDVEWHYNVNPSYNDADGFVYLGNRNRSIRLFGGSNIWESYWIKKTDDAVQIKTTEYYNYLTILELVPYPITLYTKNIAYGSSWVENIAIEYTQFDQLNNQYINNRYYPTSLNYLVTGFDETIIFNGISYSGVNTYRVSYNIGSQEMYREIMLAKDVGVIKFEDQDEVLELRFYE